MTGKPIETQTPISADKVRAVGRGASLNTPNRYEPIHVEPQYEQLDQDDQNSELNQKIATQYFVDHSATVVSQNNSPDIKFQFSINPYRGCSHGCSYCYARPYHEYLGLSAGLDFETKIFVKPNAPNLFRRWLGRKKWECQPVNLSGITDPYQPAERKFEITRGCLLVALEHNQPMYLITKNAMILRDLDMLEQMAAKNLLRVVISVTSLDQELIRVMEPRTSSPAARINAIRELALHGIDVMVNIAPIIPGLNDSEVPEILRQVADAGARAASYTIIRLTGPVEPIFLNWLEQHQPFKKSKIETGIKSMRDGKLTSTKFFDRMRGNGALAETIRSTFHTFSRRYGLDLRLRELDSSKFERPTGDSNQLRLF